MNFAPLQFDKLIPLFPLPNCVLFPGVIQPLHVFEPRYRKMMEDTLADQSAIVMALLKPGWEQDYYGAPAIHDVVCVGRVAAHERLVDGKFNLLLQGMTRAKIVREERQADYRAAVLQPIADAQGPTGLCGHEFLQRKVLRELFQRSPLKELTVASSLSALFEEQEAHMPISRLVDLVAFSMVQDPESKQRLLEERDPLLRGERLLRELVALAGKLGEDSLAEKTVWPPPVSVN